MRSTAFSVMVMGLAAACAVPAFDLTSPEYACRANSDCTESRICDFGACRPRDQLTEDGGFFSSTLLAVPARGSVGTLVRLSGVDFSTASEVVLGVPGVVVSRSTTSLSFLVMPGAASGAISVMTAAGRFRTPTAFTVLPTPLPSVQQGPKLPGTGGTGFAALGVSAALSASGDTALVGGLGDDGGVGAAWVFTRTGASWAQYGGPLVGAGWEGRAQQGRSVALSADGETAIVGGPYDRGGIGAAWVWVHSGTSWVPQGDKLSTGNAPAAQGNSVGLSADGNTALIGGWADSGELGAAWVWVRSGETWTLQQKLVGTDSDGYGLQGESVALSADGNTALIGGKRDGAVGAAWVWTRSAGVWRQQGPKLKASSLVPMETFGCAVSLSLDGNTAAIGGCREDETLAEAFIFTRFGGVWAPQGARLTASGGTSKAFRQATTVALNGEGSALLLGATAHLDFYSGAAWLFAREGAGWGQRGDMLPAALASQAALGSAVAFSSDGSTALVGGANDEGGAGAAWVFVARP